MFGVMVPITANENYTLLKQHHFFLDIRLQVTPLLASAKNIVFPIFSLSNHFKSTVLVILYSTTMSICYEKNW